MTSPSCLTLLTDFGLQDVYVGVMKGAIAQIDPRITVIDLTHAVPPQDVVTARFHLLSAYPYFPAGTVHVAVVDPGVGTTRRAIAIQTQRGVLVGPDNGLFSGILQTFPEEAIAAVELNQPQYWRSCSLSATFHGRDIFAPVGAHLATGVPLHQVGEAIALDSILHSPILPYQPTPEGFLGCIQYIDHFGNAITNIPDSCLPVAWTVLLKGRTIPGRRTYGDGQPGEPVALVGSHGWVEVAIAQGNAHTALQIKVGDSVEIQRCDRVHNSLDTT
jgi:S-adenosylmethionine hydrolase